MKKNRIKSLNENDKDALRLLAFCGNATTATLLSADLSPTRIESMHRDKLITNIDKDEKYQHKNPEATWRLTNKGKDYVKENLYIDKFACGTNAVRHNCAVAEQYSTILKRDDIKEIFSERDTNRLVEDKLKQLGENSELRSDYLDWKEKHLNKELSMPDITVITTSETIECFEIITSNYSKEEIIAKEETVKLLEAAYTAVRI